MRHMTPQQIGGRPGYVVRFRHPLQNNAVRTVGLGTRDPAEAARLAHDLELVCSDPSLLHAKPGDPRLAAYDRRVLRAIFGDDHWAVRSAAVAPAFTADDRRDLLAWVRTSVVSVAESVLRATGNDPLVCRGLITDALKGLERKVGGWAPRQYRELREQVTRLEGTVKLLGPQLEAANRRVAELEEELGRNRSTPLSEAFDRWRAWYSQGRAPRTWTEGVAVVGSFVESVGAGATVGSVRVAHIMAWADALERRQGGPLHALTRVKRRNYVRSFCGWMYRFYDLRENPAAKLLPVAGASSAPEHVVAIRRFEDLKRLIHDTPAGYWRAWVAVACLAGPRWAEQVWLKVSDVYLDDGYIRITSRASGRTVAGTKTGRERNVPIERKILMPILRDWVGAQQAAGAVWLFPSIAGPARTERHKNPDGIWSDNGVWAYAWRRVRPAWCKYGPAVWRHTAGTAMGHSGLSSLEISRILGNSEDVARRHYIAELSAGKRWPLAWH